MFSTVFSVYIIWASDKRLTIKIKRKKWFFNDCRAQIKLPTAVNKRITHRKHYNSLITVRYLYSTDMYDEVSFKRVE